MRYHDFMCLCELSTRKVTSGYLFQGPCRLNNGWQEGETAVDDSIAS